MKRKDYDLIARVIKGLSGFVSGTKSKQDPFGTTVKDLAFINFAPALKKDNTNFNTENFKKACGL